MRSHHVTDSKDDLIRRCERCGKAVNYGSMYGETLTAWYKRKREFKKVHADCKKEKSK